jgi:transcriptional regulator with GAF, ATPase, and Fis domain
MELIADLLEATAGAHSPRALELAIAKVLDGKTLPDDPAFQRALAAVLASARRHVEVVQRVAALSKRAHRSKPRETIVARSPEMRAVLDRIALVAHHPTTVLVTGESGTGKELVARELHRQSARAHGPLVQLNCAALPDTLLDSELFGHERGAFTGADRAHAGAFERAHSGTLFLDEIGELSPAAQAKLLRVLQEGQLRRVGGERSIDVDVRVVAATHRPLQSVLREDLYYRLAVFEIRIPPLRERRADIAPLASALVERLARKLGTEPPPITPDTLARLEAHDWPGNVRELANVLETALILGDGALVLPDGFTRRAERPRFESAIRETIEQALRATRGKLYGPGGAAALLGLEPSTLQSKMKKLGIARTDFV